MLAPCFFSWFWWLALIGHCPRTRKTVTQSGQSENHLKSTVIYLQIHMNAFNVYRNVVNIRPSGNSNGQRTSRPRGSIGLCSRMARRCVSLPFWWLARTANWSIKVRTGDPSSHTSGSTDQPVGSCSSISTNSMRSWIVFPTRTASLEWTVQQQNDQYGYHTVSVCSGLNFTRVLCMDLVNLW